MGKTVLRGLIESFVEAKASWDSIFLKNLEHEVESSDIKKDVYKKCLNAYICINHTARAISQIPLQIEKKRKDKWVPIEDHPWSDLLRKPNNHMSEIDFKQSIFSFLLLDGQVGIIPLPLGDRSPTELMVVRKKYFKPKVNEKGRLEHWEYSPNPTSYNSIPIYPEEMISTWFIDPDNPYTGLAPSEVGDLEILTDYKSAYYNQQFFDEGAIPGGILYTDRTLGDKSFSRTREQFVGRHQSYKRAHRIAVLDQGLKYQQLSMNLKDMDFINLKKYTREQIFQIYGMKPAVLGVTKDVNRACIPASERIYTVNRGAVSIKDVNSNDVVWSFGEEGPKKCKVINSWYQGEKKIFNLKTKNYSIRASYDHPILVLNRYEEEMSKYPHKVYRGKLEWKPIGEIDSGDFIVTSNGIPMDNESEYSEDFCKFSGAFIGDGCIEHYKGKPKYVSLAIPDFQPELRGTYKEIAKKEFHYKKIDREFEVCDKNKFSLIMAGNSTDRIIESGLNFKSLEKRIPEWAWKLSREKALAFLRGYIDTDGSVSKNGTVCVSSANKELMKDFSCYLDYVGIRHGLVKKHENISGFDTKKHTVYRLNIGNAYEIGSDDPSDSIRLNRIKDREYSRNKQYGILGRRVQDIVPNMFSIDRVISVEEDGYENVYDLEIEDRHNYICNGIVVHNTHKEEMKSWWRDTCLPLMKMMSSEITFYLSMGEKNSKNRIRVSWDMAAIEAIHEDYSEKVSTAWKLNQIGFPINDINQKLELGFENVEGGDIGFIPSSMVPIASFGEEKEKPKPEPPPEPPEEEPEEEPQEEPEEEPKPEEEMLNSKEEIFYKKLKRVLYELRKKFIKSLYSDEFKQFSKLDLTNEKKRCIILLIEVYSNILNMENPKEKAEKLSGIVDIVQSSIDKNFNDFRDKDLVADNIKKFFNSFNKKLKRIVKIECSSRGK